jgi:hypothetical protein
MGADDVICSSLGVKVMNSSKGLLYNTAPEDSYQMTAQR